ncbi:hypothetical protein [Streptomyces regalis]|uniref:hypothetical protein n=1 Tax=Streptomyces regalis TaxID=68262 RepID=UPI00131AF688|nr:hypothetical protein [Streptomyces regalis]
MSALEWLGAAGGLVGAVGGPAGLWAAVQLHQDRARREPQEQLAKLRDHVLKLRRIGQDAADDYRNRAWWTGANGLESRNCIKEMRPYVAREWPQLEALLVEICTAYDQASTTFHQPRADPDARARAAAKQARHANVLTEKANDLATKIHDLG